MYITNKRAGNQRVKQVRNGMSEIGEHIGIGTEKFGIVLKEFRECEREAECVGAKRSVGKVARDKASDTV